MDAGFYWARIANVDREMRKARINSANLRFVLDETSFYEQGASNESFIIKHLTLFLNRHIVGQASA
jgi:hypothetical protein